MAYLRTSRLAASLKTSRLAASLRTSRLAASLRTSRLAASLRKSRLAASLRTSRLAASLRKSWLAASLRKSWLAAPACTALCLAVSLPAQAASLSGVWQVAVTQVDCTSHNPLAPAFTSLLAFAGNGTESEATNNPALQPGQRSTAYGIWSKTGTNAYHMDTFALILFAGSGAHPIPQGSQQIHQDITLSGARWASTATIQFFDTTGAPVISGCATAAATRLK